jgi:hypothetical protein
MNLHCDSNEPVIMKTVNRRFMVESRIGHRRRATVDDTADDVMRTTMKQPSDCSVAEFRLAAHRPIRPMMNKTKQEAAAMVKLAEPGPAESTTKAKVPSSKKKGGEKDSRR